MQAESTDHEPDNEEHLENHEALALESVERVRVVRSIANVQDLKDRSSCEDEADLNALVIIVHVRDHCLQDYLLIVDNELPIVPGLDVLSFHAPFQLNLYATPCNWR